MAIIAFFFALFALLGAFSSVLQYLIQQNRGIEAQQKERAEMIEKKGIERACKKTLRFLNKDGSINIVAAKEYIESQKEKDRRKIETINFEVLD